MCQRSMWRGGVARRRRCPATTPAGRRATRGIRYPADPPTVDEIVAVMRHIADDRHGFRLRAMIVVLWRAGLRIHEALALAEHELDPRRGSVLVRSGRGGRRREVGMDEWGWEQVRPWLSARAELPAGPLFCIIDGPTRGRPWSGAAVRREFRLVAASGHTGLGYNVDLPTRHRSRGDPRRGPRAAGANDVGQRRATALSDPGRQAGASRPPAFPDKSRRVRAGPPALVRIGA
jgi:integrase